MAVRQSAPAGKDRELEDPFELSLNLLCIVSVDGYFKRVNLAFERTLGYTRAELLSRPSFHFMHADDREWAREAMAVLARGEALLRFENRLSEATAQSCGCSGTAARCPAEVSSVPPAAT